MKYPLDTDCDAIAAMFKGEDFARSAELDKEATTEKMQGDGYYQCYCKKNLGEDICKTYLKDQVIGRIKGTGVAILVSVVNIIFRLLSFRLIHWIGYDARSAEISNILTTVFCTNFINTGVLLLLINADLTKLSDYTEHLPLRGVYPDLNENWYADIGPALVQTMQISAVMPYIEFSIAYFIKCLMRMLDSGCYCCKEKKTTKKVTMQ